MKRIVTLIAIGLLLFPLSSYSENFVEALASTSDVTITYAEIGDRLVIMGDYDKLANNTENGLQIDGTMEQYKEELRKYKSILVLMLKDDAIYLAAEIPLADGVIIEGAGSPLMSVKYMMENTHIQSD